MALLDLEGIILSSCSSPWDVSLQDVSLLSVGRSLSFVADRAQCLFPVPVPAFGFQTHQASRLPVLLLTASCDSLGPDWAPYLNNAQGYRCCWSTDGNWKEMAQWFRC